MELFPATGVMLSLMAVPMLLLYMAYYWAPQMNSAATMRFILPTFPLYLVAGIWAMQELTARAPAAARVAVPASLIGVQLLWGLTDLRAQTQRLKYSKQTLAMATDSIQRFAAPGDVVVGNNQILQQLDFVRDWKLADASVLRGGRMMGGPGPRGRNDEPDAPSPMQQEKRDIQQEKYSGTFTQRFNKFADDVHAWAGDQKVWYVGPERDSTKPWDRIE
jgi:hypothetical protein